MVIDKINFNDLFDVVKNLRLSKPQNSGQYLRVKGTRKIR